MPRTDFRFDLKRHKEKLPRRGGWFGANCASRFFCSLLGYRLRITGMLENSPADTTQLPTGCQPESLAKLASSPLAQGNPAAAAYAPRELDDHSFGPEDIASMSAAFEAP
jgi:hypothetical protein